MCYVSVLCKYTIVNNIYYCILLLYFIIVFCQISQTSQPSYVSLLSYYGYTIQYSCQPEISQPEKSAYKYKSAYIIITITIKYRRYIF